MVNKTCVVELTFKRIQQFLFAVPRLKAMLGANALLGETIREDLVELVSKHSPFSINGDGVPNQCSTAPIDDDPFALYKKGIISRDGGHFTAAFQSKESAEDFINAAQQKVLEKLPGVMLEASLRTESNSEFKAKKITTATHFGETSTRLPQLRVCEDTGTEIANDKRKEDPQYVSKQVNVLEKAGDKFRRGKTKDIIGQLLDNDLLPAVEKNTKEETSGESEPKDNSNIPKDLKELAGKSGYIAVIHADGNSIGIRRKLYAGKNEKPANFDEYIENEVKNEQFFHAMRTTIRQCVLEALKEVFPDEEIGKDDKLPYQLLMLGGDDLLLITQPQYAFPFVIEYSRELAKIPILYKDENINKPISIGAGIAIASHNIPFYHLHHLAESLASSAKKLYRSQVAAQDETPEERSVVDWLVATTSWIDDIEVSRQQDDLHVDKNNGELYCTSAKPYFVLPDPKADDKDSSFNLKTLWKAADKIAKQYQQDEKEGVGNEEKLPRSKLKALLETISQFDIEKSKKHYQNITPLPDKFKQLFSEKGECLWQEIEGNHLTQYKDLMELIELHFLGQQTKSSDQPSTNDKDQQEEHHG